MQIDPASLHLSESADFAMRFILAILVLSVLFFTVNRAVRLLAGEKGRSLGARKLWMLACNLIILIVLFAGAETVEAFLQLLGNTIEQLLPFLETGFPAGFLFGLFYTTIATLSLVLFIQVIGAVYWWWRGRVEAACRTFERKSEAQRSNVRLHLLKGLLLLADGFRAVTIVIGLLVFFPMVFRFFPRTAPFVQSLQAALGTPARDVGREFVEYIPNLGYLLIILTLGWLFLRLIQYLFDSLRTQTLTIPGFEPEWAAPTYKLCRAVLLFFLLMVSFPYLPGADSQFFQGFSVFVGALLTLGSAGAIGNIVAGVILTYTGAFRLGDWVTIGETTGEVLHKSLLVTRIRTIRNVVVTIPNGTVVSSHVLNYSRADKDGLVLTVAAGIGYDVDWRVVHKLMLDAAAETENLLSDPAPCVWQEGLGDYAVNYELRVWSNRPKAMDETHSSLRRNVLESFNRAGVEIMTPSVLAHRDGSSLALPEDQASERPKPPGISVDITTRSEG